MKPSSRLGLASLAMSLFALVSLANLAHAAGASSGGMRGPSFGGGVRPAPIQATNTGVVRPGQPSRPGGQHHHQRVFVTPGFGPFYGYGEQAAAPQPPQQVIVQPVITQTQIVQPSYVPAYAQVACNGPRIIQVTPSRGTRRMPNVIYGSADPCLMQRAASTGPAIHAAY